MNFSAAPNPNKLLVTFDTPDEVSAFVMADSGYLRLSPSMIRTAWATYIPDLQFPLTIEYRRRFLARHASELAVCAHILSGDYPTLAEDYTSVSKQIETALAPQIS